MLGDSREPETRHAFRWMAGAVATFCVVLAVLLAGIAWYDAAMIGRFFAILIGIAITVFMLGVPLWPWLMRRRR
jgi:hypothetical protein